MKKLLFVILLIIAAGNHALADGPDPLLSSDSRIKPLKYNEEDVYTITTKYGYQTNIVFGKGEEVQTISVGDRSMWQLVPAGNRLFIRPMEFGMQTNMTLITNKHSYQFDLKSVADEKSSGNIYVAQFYYPEDEAKEAAKKASASMPPVFLLAQAALNHPAAPDQPEPVFPPVASKTAHAQPQPVLTPPVANSPAPLSPHLGYNYNYTYAGPDAGAPVQAYDDGKSTFIQYRQNQQLPSVYMIDANGKTETVSYTVQNDLIVVSTVAGEWQLEGNDGTVYLYNEMLTPE